MMEVMSIAQAREQSALFRIQPWCENRSGESEVLDSRAVNSIDFDSRAEVQWGISFGSFLPCRLYKTGFRRPDVSFE